MKASRARDIEILLGASDSQTFGVYIGYQAIGTCIGPTKIGRTVNVKAIERGRSQGGADWWFHSFWPLSDRALTYKIEALVKKTLSEYRTKGGQSQTELYSLSLAEAETRVSQLLGPSII